ncbi:hypothetical protein E2C01_035579 [Portunus trituberculatus]|uniref:Uncharacterized protein n=1 Tax=Portunus trituberculatus TaxID=210409 RepID=A0A5B7F9Q7_PORTR|nr:hypothetical protein [Portunus trituberculatus]
MATPNPASEPSSGERTLNVSRSDCSSIGNPKCLDSSLNFFLHKLLQHSQSSMKVVLRHHTSITKCPESKLDSVLLLAGLIPPTPLTHFLLHIIQECSIEGKVN